MKPLNVVFFLLCITVNVKSYAAGGPDAYGYTWLDSNDPGGPIYSWIDISTIGTEIVGLGDDNSVTQIAMGLSFRYYWIDYTEIKIGSNGWLSFNDVDNLASCFSNIPTAGGAADNFVAPFMSDLNFAGTDNPAKAYYYHDSVNNLFIVSFLDVPYFRNNSNRHIGSNSFQVIFSVDDKSITFQYQDIDQENFVANNLCPYNLVVGMENITGDIGLQTHQNVMPEDNYTIEFIYPDVPLIDVVDPSPIWNQNNSNTATLYEANQDVDLQVNIANLGNADHVSPIDVLVEVLDENSNIVHSEPMQIAQLSSQENMTLNLSNPLNVASGRYHLKVSTDSAEDLVMSNNVLSTELNVVNTNMSPVVLGHTTGIPSLSRSGSRKQATFFTTPAGSWLINSVSMYIRDSHLPGSEDYMVSVYANDGVNGLPGSLLASELVEEGTYPTFSWVNTVLSQPIVAPTNGFFVAWENANASSSGVGLGIETLLPISRRSYSFSTSGIWSVSRTNLTEDYSIEAELTENIFDMIFVNGFE